MLRESACQMTKTFKYVPFPVIVTGVTGVEEARGAKRGVPKALTPDDDAATNRPKMVLRSIMKEDYCNEKVGLN